MVDAGDAVDIERTIARVHELCLVSSLEVDAIIFEKSLLAIRSRNLKILFRALRAEEGKMLDIRWSIK